MDIKKKSQPISRLGVASLLTPILTMVVAILINAALPPVAIEKRNSWGPVFPDGFIWVIGVLVLGPAMGIVLSICSLWKKERPILAAIGLTANAVFLLLLLLETA